MKSNHRNARAALKASSEKAQPVFQRAELVIYLHSQGLKHLGSRMMTAVAADQFLDRPRQRQSFAKRRRFSHFYDQACYTARRRLPSQLAKQARQLFLGVFVYDRGSGQLRPRVHAHIERAVSHEAESTLRVFELPGGHPKIKKCAAYHANASSSRTPSAHLKFACSTARRLPTSASCSLTCWRASGSWSSARTIAPL